MQRESQMLVTTFWGNLDSIAPLPFVSYRIKIHAHGKKYSSSRHSLEIIMHLFYQKDCGRKTRVPSVEIPLCGKMPLSLTTKVNCHVSHIDTGGSRHVKVAFPLQHPIEGEEHFTSSGNNSWISLKYDLQPKQDSYGIRVLLILATV